MRKWLMVGILFLFVISLIVILVIYGVRLPISSTNMDYILNKISSLFGIPFVLDKGYRDLRGNIVFGEVSYKPEFYGKDFYTPYDSFINFLSGSTNSICFSFYSNSLNFQDLSRVIGRLGLSEEEVFDIATNVVDYYVDNISSNSFTNLFAEGKIKNKDIFYKNSEKLINAWIDVSVRISKLELEISKNVDSVKKQMEEDFNSFRQEVYTEYLKDFEKGKAKVTSDIFVNLLDKEMALLKTNLVSCQNKVDSIYSKLSILKEGYKIGWEQRVEMLKKDPQKYVERYISMFPYYLIKRLVSFNFLEIPEILSLRNPKYCLVVSNNVILLNISGYMWQGGEFYFEGVVSNGVWNGNIDFKKLNNISKISDVSASFYFKPFQDTLNGDYVCNVKLKDKQPKEVLLSLITNQKFVENIIRELTSEEGFVSLFISDESDNLFRSYREQYQRYKVGIEKDVKKVYYEFKVEVEKSKQKLKKSYLK